MKKVVIPNTIDVGTTWVDGRIIFKLDKKWSEFWFGVCHYSKSVYAVTPRDYPKPTMMASIDVAPPSKYCERAESCLNFTCDLNRFSKDEFVKAFKDSGPFTLGLPLNLGEEPLWFSVGEWKDFWVKMIIPITGGKLEYKEGE